MNKWVCNLSYTDLYSEQFVDAVKCSISFFDSNCLTLGEEMPKRYKKFQEFVSKQLSVDDIISRKVINSLVKLGFLYPNVTGFNEDACHFIKAEKKEKEVILSKIIYQYGNLGKSMIGNDCHSDENISLLIDELIKQQQMTDFQIAEFCYGSEYNDSTHWYSNIRRLMHILSNMLGIILKEDKVSFDNNYNQFYISYGQ